MRRSTRAQKREHDAGEKTTCAAPAEAAAAAVPVAKRTKRGAAATRASSDISPPADDDTDGTGKSDAVASRGIAAPQWVRSLFSAEQRATWAEFLRAKCLARVNDDFFDLYELARAVSKDRPLDAFVDSLGIQLCGLFDLLDRAASKRADVTVDKPLFLHGRFFLDPPEVTTVLRDATSDSNGAHWGYFRDAPEQSPAYVVYTEDSLKCSFAVAGSNLFHVLDARIKGLHARRTTSPALKELEGKVGQYLRSQKIPASATPASLSRKRASQATAASLHKLGIVVPYDAKKQTGWRELPVVGEQLAALLQQVQGGNAKARKTLSGLITRATIANDECDFGTSLLLGLDLFTAGTALEKEALQLLRVAYMLLKRMDFYKIASAHATHRRAGEPACASQMLRGIVPASGADTHGADATHVADGSQPKLTTLALP